MAAPHPLDRGRGSFQPLQGFNQVTRSDALLLSSQIEPLPLHSAEAPPLEAFVVVESLPPQQHPAVAVLAPDFKVVVVEAAAEVEAAAATQAPVRKAAEVALSVRLCPRMGRLPGSPKGNSFMGFITQSLFSERCRWG